MSAVNDIYTIKRDIKDALIYKGAPANDELSTYAEEIYTWIPGGRYDMRYYKFNNTYGGMIGGGELPDWVKYGIWNNVTNMWNEFSGSWGASVISGLSSLSRVTTISRLCAENVNLTYVNLSNLITCTTARQAFQNCTKLREVHLYGLQKLTNTSQMFQNCTSLKVVELSACSALTTLSNAFGTGGVISTITLKDCPTFTDISPENLGEPTVLNLNLWRFGSADLSSVYANRTPADNVNLSSFSNTTNAYGLFAGDKVKKATIRQFPLLTSLEYAFGSCTSLTNVTISNCPVLSNMSTTFWGCSQLESITLNDCMSKVNNVYQCFYGCNSLKTLNLTGSLPNINLTNWSLPYQNLPASQLMNIINALTSTTSSRTCTLGTTNLNKLTAAQKKVATDKGWTLN